MTDAVRDFLDALDVRLSAGAQEYGDQSFVKPIAETMREIIEEAVDQVGWCYVLWCQAARKTDMVRDQVTLRQHFLETLEHRIRRNDRRAPYARATGPGGCMAEIEVLAIDLFLQHQELCRRLVPIVRAIEVAQAISPHHNWGRRGGRSDPRSDD